MQILKALPQKKLTEAAQHSKSAEWIAKRDEAISLIRLWSRDDRTNKRLPFGVWTGYGKDGCAIQILFKMADVPYTALSVVNGGDLPVHEGFGAEFDRWIGEHDHIVYRPERRYVEYLYKTIQIGRKNGFLKDDKSGLVDFWDQGVLGHAVNWEISNRFTGLYDEGFDEPAYVWGNRTGEDMAKFYRFRNLGMKQFFRVENSKQKPYWECEPILGWKDIDVWALLITENAPISPVYSYHDIPQRGGKHAFPRTLWYPSAGLFSPTYYKWLARYAPAQLQELNHLFPEILEVLKKPS